MLDEVEPMVSQRKPARSLEATRPNQAAVRAEISIVIGKGGDLRTVFQGCTELLATTLDRLRGAIPSSNRKLRKLLADSQTMADQCVREVRTLSYVLHPPMLDEAGLEDAIRQYVEGFTARSGIPVEVKVSPRFGRMTRDIELALFRVVQESLTNIQRHSGSRKAEIRITSDGDTVTLEVSDKGRGIDGSERRQAGLKQTGGRLEIESRSGGTTVRAVIPAENQRQQELSNL